jgi:hypothetical protein
LSLCLSGSLLKWKRPLACWWWLLSADGWPFSPGVLSLLDGGDSIVSISRLYRISHSTNCWTMRKNRARVDARISLPLLNASWPISHKAPVPTS